MFYRVSTYNQSPDRISCVFFLSPQKNIKIKKVAKKAWNNGVCSMAK